MRHPLSAKKTAYLTHLREEKRLSASTLRIYASEIDQFFDLCKSPRDLKPLRDHLKEKSPATVRRKLMIWKAFLEGTSWRGLFDDFPLPKMRQKQPRFLTEREIFQLESACYHQDKKTTRDRLLIACGLQLGLRLSELRYLRFSDVSEDWVRVIRKGEKEQRLPLSQSLRVLFQFWKTESFAESDDFVFASRDGRPLSDRGVQKILDRLAKRAKLTRRITPHSLRHTFASILASKGANLVALKELLGHESIRTTERYLHVTPEHLRETVNLFSHKNPPRLNET